MASTLGERSQFSRSSLRRSKRKAQGFGQSKFLSNINTVYTCKGDKTYEVIVN